MQASAFFCSLIKTLLFVAMMGVMPAAAYAACANPTGADGDIVYNQDKKAFQGCAPSGWMAFNSKSYTPTAVNFNGSSWLKRGGGLTGVADGKQFTMSFWFRSTDGSDWKRIFSAPASSERFLLNAEAAGTSTCLFLRTQTSAGAAVIDLRFACNAHNGQWQHVMMSFDVNAGLWHTYVNGVSEGSIYNLNNQNMDFTHTNWGIGVEPVNNWNPWVNGQIADFWVDFGTYINLSIQANREKFYKNGPVYLGDTGNLPTGTAPDIFLSGDLGNWHTNKGTGGGFTMTGALSTVPFSRAEGPVTGLLGHWRLDDGSGSVAVDSTGASNATLTNGPLWSKDGMSGGAMQFSGSNYLLASSTVLNGLTIPMTISFWIQDKGTTSLWQSFLMKTNWSNAGWSFHRWDSTPDIYLRVDTTGGTNQATSQVPGVLDGNWHHVTYTISGNTVVAYKDGVQVDTDTFAPGAGIANTEQLRIGENMPIALDDIRIYGRALSGPEVQSLYNSFFCASPMRTIGTIVYNGTQRVFQGCTPDGWKALHSRGSGGGGCSSPAGAASDIVYNASAQVFQGCTVDGWQALNPPAPVCTVTVPGNACPDGSIYAGISPDGNVPMYTTPADVGVMLWKSGAGWNDAPMVNCTDGPPGTAATCRTGAANTAALAGYADSSVPYTAALACHNLVAHGHDDWYLPSQDELSVIYPSRAAIGGFPGVGSYLVSEHYWSSSEQDNSHARVYYFGDDISAEYFAKNDPASVRCIRK